MAPSVIHAQDGARAVRPRSPRARGPWPNASSHGKGQAEQSIVETKCEHLRFPRCAEQLLVPSPQGEARRSLRASPPARTAPYQGKWCISHKPSVTVQAKLTTLSAANAPMMAGPTIGGLTMISTVFATFVTAGSPSWIVMTP